MTPASPETHLIGNHASLYLTWNRNRHFSAFSVQQQYLVFMFQRTAFNSRKPVFGCTWYQEHDKMKQKPTSIRCHFTIHSYGPYRKTRGIIIYSGSHSPQNMNQMLIYSGEKKKKKTKKHTTHISRPSEKAILNVLLQNIKITNIGLGYIDTWYTVLVFAQ